MQIDLDNVAYIGETSVTIRKSRRRITIPKEIVENLNITDGDRIRWVLFNDESRAIICSQKVGEGELANGSSSINPDIVHYSFQQ